MEQEMELTIVKKYKERACLSDDTIVLKKDDFENTALNYLSMYFKTGVNEIVETLIKDSKNKLEYFFDRYKEEINKRDFVKFSAEIAKKYGVSGLKSIQKCWQSMIQGLNLVDEARKSYYIDNENVIFSLDRKKLIRFDPGFDSAAYKEEYTIPPFVETVEDGAFANNIYLKKIVIPDNVKRLGNKAFQNCKNLQELVFGKVKSGGSQIFDGCKNLAKVYVDDENNLWNYVSDDSSPFKYGADLYVNGCLGKAVYFPVGGNISSFIGCKSIKEIYFEGDNKSIEWILLNKIKR